MERKEGERERVKNRGGVCLSLGMFTRRRTKFYPTEKNNTSFHVLREKIIDGVKNRMKENRTMKEGQEKVESTSRTNPNVFLWFSLLDPLWVACKFEDIQIPLTVPHT